jgi:hypothetical protein
MQWEILCRCGDRPYFLGRNPGPEVHAAPIFLNRSCISFHRITDVKVE